MASMATKAEERKALEQIKSIINSLGENSYVATAFEGCFEIAEDNIENDWGCSMKQRWESSEKNSEYFHNLANEEIAEISKLRDQLTEMKASYEERITNLNDTHEKRIAYLNGIHEERITYLNGIIDDLRKEVETSHEDAIKERKEVKIKCGDTDEMKQFSKIVFHNDNGFRFVTITEKSGWTDSYRIEDIEILHIG